MKTDAELLLEIRQRFNEPTGYRERWEALVIVRDACKIKGDYPGINSIERFMTFVGGPDES